MQHHTGRARLAAVATALLVLAAGCGSGGADERTSAAGPTTTNVDPTGSPATGTGGAAAPRPDVPSVEVQLLSADTAVDLRSLVTPGRPTVLWFWAPHCTFCRREAPDLLAFAAEHDADIDILGVGAQDSLDEARAFLDETGTDGLTMVWDRTGESWVHYGVTSQPTVLVLGPDGSVTRTWFRDFQPDEILAAAGLG